MSNMLKSGVVAPFCSPALGCLRRRDPCRIGANLGYTVRPHNNKMCALGCSSTTCSMIPEEPFKLSKAFPIIYYIKTTILKCTLNGDSEE